AGGVAQWGRLRWQGENGAGAIALRTRSGNSLRPDPTWSEWSEPLRDPAGAQIKSPNARYLQYEAELTGAGVTLENVSAAYLPQNNPPVVKSVTVLAAVSATNAGTAKPATTVTDTGDATP